MHHLLYAPDFEAADRITAALARIGNLASDGRPILGLDSRDLLDITLSAGPGCFLVPAHVWTPWFAVLGSKSGFDAVRDCYADLADHIAGAAISYQCRPAFEPADRRRDPDQPYPQHRHTGPTDSLCRAHHIARDRRTGSRKTRYLYHDLTRTEVPVRLGR